MSTITWLPNADGLWTDGADWLGGIVPGAGDTAVFGAGQTNSATIAVGGTVSAGNVILSGNTAGGSDYDALDLLGTLDLGGTLSLGAGSGITSFASAGSGDGVISGGTLDLSGGGELTGFALHAVTVIGSPPGGGVFGPTTITGGLTSLAPVLSFTGTADFAGSQTLSAVAIDTGTITLDGTLTIAAGTTVENASGSGLSFSDDATGGGALVNDGAIVDSSGTAANGIFGYAVDLTNAGSISLTGTYEMSGIAVVNTGTLKFAGPGYLSVTPSAGQAFRNSGLFQVTGGGTLEDGAATFDNTGGTLSLAAGGVLSLAGTMLGGTLVGAGGTIAEGPFGGTLDGVGLAGSLNIVQAHFADGTSFVSRTAGVRASATVESLNLIGASTIDDVNLLVSMLSVTQPGGIGGNGAVTFGASSDLAFQNTDTARASTVAAATSLTLAGTIEASANGVKLSSGGAGLTNTGVINVGSGELLSMVATNGGVIDNTGTVGVAAGGTLSITTTDSLVNTGMLNLASGSTLDLGASLSAASFAGVLQTGVSLVFDGTLTGSAVAGNGSISLPSGSVVQFGFDSTLRDVTVLDSTPTTVGGTLDGVTWQGDALDITNMGNVVVDNGLTVLNGTGGAGTIVIGGTNSILNFQTNTTLDNVAIMLGSTLASPGNDSFSVIDGSNAALGTDSNLTIGANASVTILGNEYYNGFNNIGTLTVAGRIQIGGSGAASPHSARDASSMMSASGVPVVSTNDLDLLTPAQLDNMRFADWVRQTATFDADAAAQDYTNQLGGLLDGATTPGRFSPAGTHSQTSASSTTPPADLATTNETTIEGGGTLSVGNDGLSVLNAVIGAGIDLSFDATHGFFALTDPGKVAARITNFGAGDGIDLAFHGFNGGTLTYANGQLTIPTSNGSFALNVAFAAGYSAADLQLADDGVGGTVAFITACFASSTRISTEHGDIAVEDLQPGMCVRLASGGTRPVIWTGHRRIDCTRHPRPHDVNPVRVRAHAFGPGQPARDLRLSPDHAVSIDGVLIPVRYLLNDRTIVQESVASVMYWHVELDGHDVLLAEGLPAESYLDTGNRGAFANAGISAMHADLRPVAMGIWAKHACAKLVLDGAELEAARSFVNMRAGDLGYRITLKPSVRVTADGVVIEPVERDEHCAGFVVPDGTGHLRLVSEAAIPARVADAHPDHRRLGVLVEAIAVDGIRIDLDRLSGGWHAPERDGVLKNWRWTDGDAAVPVGRTLAVRYQALETGYVASPTTACETASARRW